MANINVKSVLTFGKEVSEYSWPPMTEREVNRMQRVWPSLVAKLVAAGTDKANGQDPAGNDKSGRDLFVYEWIGTDSASGKPWHDFTLRYHDLPAQAAQWLKGILSGELRDWDKSARKEKRHK